MTGATSWRWLFLAGLALLACAGSKSGPAQEADDPSAATSEDDAAEGAATVQRVEDRPLLVRPHEMAAVRTGGEAEPTIAPELAAAIAADKPSKVVAVYRLCIDPSGNLAEATRVKSSGYAAFDQEAERVVRTWTHDPFVFDGQAMAVCTAIAITYHPTAAP